MNAWMPWFSRAIRFCLLAGMVALAPALAAQAETVDFEQIEADLAGPVTLLLQNGNRQSGRIVSWDGESMRLAVQLGGGSAEMRFTADQIREITFPGADYLRNLDAWTADPARAQDALALFRAFYKQRGPYLQYMDAYESDLFVRYARFALEQNEALMAISIINVLRPHIEDEALLKSLDDAILLAFFLGGMREEAETQAHAWIEAAHPAGPSALGWRILAEIHFLDEQYESAFWTALHPVAFANQMPMEHLDACYAFAIAAAGKNRQDEVQARLHQEMRARSLGWPANIPTLAGLEPDRNDPPKGEPTDIEGEPETTSPADQATTENNPATPAPATPAEPDKPEPASSLPSRLPQLSK